jgi:hypothetical protein
LLQSPFKYEYRCAEYEYEYEEVRESASGLLNGLLRALRGSVRRSSMRSKRALAHGAAERTENAVGLRSVFFASWRLGVLARKKTVHSPRRKDAKDRSR